MTPQSTLPAGKNRAGRRAKKNQTPLDLSAENSSAEISSPHRSTGWLPAIIGGVAGGLAYDPFALGFLIVLTPLAFFIALRLAPTPRGAFLRVLAGGYIFYGIAISWLCSLGHFNPFAPVGIAFLAFYMALYPAVGAWITRRWFGRLGLMQQFAVFGSLFLLGEWFRTVGKLSMPFTLTGNAWVQYPWSVQLADTFGELGISAQILLLAASILALAEPFAKKWHGLPARAHGLEAHATHARKRQVFIGSTLAAVSLFLLATSAYRYHFWENRLNAARPEDKLSVAAIQPNIDQDSKLATNMEEDEIKRLKLLETNFKIHQDLVLQKVPVNTDLVVMPESSFSDFEFSFDRATHERIAAMMQPSGADLLFGADRIHVHEDQKNYDAYNTAWFLPHGKTMREAAYQDKMHLVPFGEYLPYFDMIPGFQETIVQIGSFTSGDKVTIFKTETEGKKFGALVCFESTFGSLGRELVKAGAEFITIITNDAWYGRSAGAAQHHRFSILRAIETRRPIVRSANTGISSIIRPSGKIEATLARGKMGVITGEIVPQTTRTLFVRWGNIWVVGAALIVIAFFIFRIRTRPEAALR